MPDYFVGYHKDKDDRKYSLSSGSFFQRMITSVCCFICCKMMQGGLFHTISFTVHWFGWLCLAAATHSIIIVLSWIRPPHNTYFKCFLSGSCCCSFDVTVFEMHLMHWNWLAAFSVWSLLAVKQGQSLFRWSCKYLMKVPVRTSLSIALGSKEIKK